MGHEDIGYSYVVVRRGPRPSAALTKLGRIGQVGKRQLEKEALAQVPVKELTLHSEHEEAQAKAISFTPIVESVKTVDGNGHSKSPKELDTALRLEGYHWPRLVFPPLKNSGHIILDGCTPEGEWQLLL